MTKIRIYIAAFFILSVCDAWIIYGNTQHAVNPPDTDWLDARIPQLNSDTKIISLFQSCTSEGLTSKLKVELANTSRTIIDNLFITTTYYYIDFSKGSGQRRVSKETSSVGTLSLMPGETYIYNSRGIILSKNKHLYNCDFELLSLNDNPTRIYTISTVHWTTHEWLESEIIKAAQFEFNDSYCGRLDRDGINGPMTRKAAKRCTKIYFINAPWPSLKYLLELHSAKSARVRS